MARKKTQRRTNTAIAPVSPSATRPQTIVVRAPSPVTTSRRKKIRDSFSSAGKTARSALLGIPTEITAAAAAGAVVGLMKSSGILEKIPRLPYVGRIGSAAVAAYFLAMHTNNRMIGDVSRALFSLSAFQLASSDKKIEDRIEGPDEDSLADFVLSTAVVFTNCNSRLP